MKHTPLPRTEFPNLLPRHLERIRSAPQPSTRAEATIRQALGDADAVMFDCEVNDVDSPTRRAVANTLAVNGNWKITDYRKGLAQGGPYNRLTRIGKLLVDLNASQLLNAFMHDPAREAHKHSHVIISRHVNDIMGMSTRRRWSSCMNLDNRGVNSQTRFLAGDIRRGSLVAYLVPHGDLTIANPLARVTLKPYYGFARNDVVLRAVRRYGTHNDHFMQLLNQWCEHYYPMRLNVPYRLGEASYSDGGHRWRCHPASDNIDRWTDDAVSVCRMFAPNLPIREQKPMWSINNIWERMPGMAHNG